MPKAVGVPLKSLMREGPEEQSQVFQVQPRYEARLASSQAMTRSM